MEISKVAMTTTRGVEGIVSRQRADPGQAEEWQTVAQALKPPVENSAIPTREASPSGNHKPTGAEVKLTELLMAQALRTILPKQEGQGGSTASETWRSMLADIVAEKVAGAMPAVADLSQEPKAALGRE